MIPSLNAVKLGWTVVAALAVLLGGLIGLVNQQFESDMSNAINDARNELEFVSNITQILFATGETLEIPRVLKNWGDHTPDVLTTRISTGDAGFVIGEFQRQLPAVYTLPLQTTFTTLDGTRVTIEIVKDLRLVYDKHNVLSIQLAIAFSAAAIALLYLMRLWFLRQRETAALNKANAALHLENAQRREAEAALYVAKERAEVTVRSIADGVVTTDQSGHIRYVNPVAERLLGWASDEIMGKDIAEVLVTIDERTRQLQQNSVLQCLASGVDVKPSEHTVLIGRNGRETPIEDASAPLRNQHGEIIGAVLVLHDVSASRELANRLSWQATHDSLTGLINRREFDHRVTLALQDARAEHSAHALLYIDLDQFKTINDVCGHIAGDALLQQVSTLMQSRMRANDTLARLGGDEFGVLLMNCPEQQAQRIAEALLRSVREFRFVWERKPFDIGASIGLVMITRNSGDLSSVLYSADFACYSAKEQGRNRLYVYREGAKLPGKGPRNRLQAATLRDAMAHNKFVLYAQPMRALRENAPQRFEVLLRLRGPRTRISLPGHFLPSADRHELMPSLDQWVVNQLLTTLGKFLRSNDAENLCAHINLSSATILRGDIVNFTGDLLRRLRIPAQRLCFDIGEASAISQLTHALRLMTDIRQLGCGLNLDDFGAGISSFGHLKNLPVNSVAISGDIVARIVDEPAEQAIVSSIVTVCRTLNIETIAKHIGNSNIQDQVTLAGVDYAQGFVLAPPVPLEQLFVKHLRPTSFATN